MKRNLSMLGLTAILGAAMAMAHGCSPAADSKTPSKQASAEDGKKGHAAHHGGSLNAIELCSVGHAEVKLEGNVLRCWFVGGETETDKSVRVPDKEIRLTVKLASGEEKPLILAAKPLELAGETVGDCSYFEASADWLKGLTTFEATGTVTCKGKARPLRILYPEGYDPDDEPAAGAQTSTATQQ